MFVKQAFAQNIITNPALPELYSSGPGEGLATLIASLWRTIILLGGLGLLVFLIWGGAEWMLAGSDTSKVEHARARIQNALLGIGLLAASLAVILILQYVLHLDILKPVFTGPGG